MNPVIGLDVSKGESHARVFLGDTSWEDLQIQT